MQNPFQANLRKPWLLLCTSLLVVYSIAPGAHETFFFSNASGSLIEALMFLLSFPLGTAAVFLFHSADFGVMERFAFWAAAMGIGYAQWFHLFPALLRRHEQTQFTTQNPPAAESVASRTPLGLGALDPARPPVPQFNERGMTPLERIFRDEEE
jgi:hypothetical protein